ncbi:MAG TPA: hypothetical protein VF019_07735, partial [Nitrospira sp.]
PKPKNNVVGWTTKSLPSRITSNSREILHRVEADKAKPATLSTKLVADEKMARALRSMSRINHVKFF